MGRVLLSVLALAAFTASAGPLRCDRFTADQWSVIRLSYQTGAPHSRGFTLAGVALRETRAGAGASVAQSEDHVPEVDRSRGPWQIRPSTAADLMWRYPDLGGAIGEPGTQTEAQLRALHGPLIDDRPWAARVALRMLLWLERQGLARQEAVTAYPLGLGGFLKGTKRGWLSVDTYPYTVEVQGWVQLLERDPTCRRLTVAVPDPR